MASHYSRTLQFSVMPSGANRWCFKQVTGLVEGNKRQIEVDGMAYSMSWVLLVCGAQAAHYPGACGGAGGQEAGSRVSLWKAWCVHWLVGRGFLGATHTRPRRPCKAHVRC
jgi:hypothetical protein